MHSIRRLSLICLFALLVTAVAGQKNISSPYGRYGIGNLSSQGTFRTLAMGGISSGIRNNLTLNYQTPASYSSIDTASFIFDFGLDYGVTRLNDGNLNYSSSDLNFSHLLLGFPIMKGFGFSAGIMPFSNGNYVISDEFSPDLPGLDVAGTLTEMHKGVGGYQKAVIGTGYSPFRNLSVGINAFIVFGDITRYNEFAFGASNSSFNTRKQTTNSLVGIGYEASMQLMVPLSERRFVNAGLTFTPGMNLRTKNDEMVMRYSYIQTSLLAFDTVYYNKINTTSRFPYTIRGGISFGQEDKLTVGADIVYSAWSEASLPGNYGTYANTISLGAGAEYIPDKYSNYSFIKRIEYRAGCHFDESYALYEGAQVKQYGLTLGAGVPLRKSRSRISLYVDWSTRGNTDNGLYKESMITAGLSLNLFDFWFLKAKYD
ncbi:MAG: hypothetical protein WCD55_13045 [Bacteroidales bacterium]